MLFRCIRIGPKLSQNRFFTSTSVKPIELQNFKDVEKYLFKYLEIDPINFGVLNLIAKNYTKRKNRRIAKIPKNATIAKITIKTPPISKKRGCFLCNQNRFYLLVARYLTCKKEEMFAQYLRLK